MPMQAIYLNHRLYRKLRDEPSGTMSPLIAKLLEEHYKGEETYKGRPNEAKILSKVKKTMADEVDKPKIKAFLAKKDLKNPKGDYWKGLGKNWGSPTEYAKIKLGLVNGK